MDNNDAKNNNDIYNNIDIVASEKALANDQLSKFEQPASLPIPSPPTPTAANIPAVISSANVSLNETNFTLNTSGKLTISDVDSPATFVAQANVAGANGVFNLSTTGSWIYVANSAFNNLNIGQSVSDTFTVHSVDGTASSVTVTINGTNDAAVLGTARIFLTETNTALSTGGTLSITDVDNPATFVAQTNVAGTNGVFNIGTNGAWTYVANSPLNNLSTGQNVSDQFNVTSSDGTVTTVQVTINGTNDPAVLSSATATLTETDTVLSTSGTLTISDVDSPAAFVAQTNVTGINGTFNLSTNGAWTYTAKSAFNNLNVGQNISDTFTVRSIDGTVSTVKVIITGTNDTAIVSSESVTVAETDAALSISGALTVSDVDNPPVFVAQGSVAGTYGTFDFGLDGTWVYVANTALDEMNVGQSVSDQFNVASADGTMSSVQVTITGTNDAAILSSATIILDETNAALTTGGTLTISDVDSPATFVAQTNVAGANGVFNIDADGAWTYTANRVFDELRPGQSVNDQFNVTSADGTVTTVQVTINGTNDAAVLSSASVTLAETNAPLSTGGTLSISDVDSPASFVAQSHVVGTNGVFNIGTNGAWTYVANSAFNNLNIGQSVSDQFNVESDDGTVTTVQITINGTNDAAVLSSASVTLAETNAALSTGGVLTISDVDSAATFVAQTNVAGTNGVFNIGTNGAWTYVANSAFNNLNAGQSVSDTFTVASADGTASSVQVTIIGTNDAAVLSSATVALSEINAALSTGGTLTISDEDSPTTFVAQTNVAGTNGVFNIGTNGAWTYVANSAFNNLNVGQSVSDTFTVASDDGTTSTVQVTINGTNDAAVLSSASVTLAETNVALSTGGTLTVSDVDNPAAFVAQTNVAGANGIFNIGANGAWTYIANNAFNNLNVGQSVSDTFTVKSVDGTASSVKVTINGTNDVPVTKADVARVVEGSVLSNPANVLANDGDADNGSLIVSELAQNASGGGAIVVNGVNTITTALGGTVLMHANGTYSYTAPVLNHSGYLTLTDSFFYKAGDGSAQSAWTQVNIVVTDTVPVAYEDVNNVAVGGATSGNVITGAGGNGDGVDKIGVDATSISSVDYHGTTYSNFVSGNLTINAEHGTLVINQNGSYNYHSTEKLTSAGAGNSLASWTGSGIQVLGYSMGAAVFGTSTTPPAIRSNYGLYIDSSGSTDNNDQLDSNGSTKTETLVLNMGSDHRAIQATFRDVQSDDQIGWKTYDSNHNLVDSGIINNTANGTGNRQEASFTINSDAPFRYIAFYGTDSNDDFTLWSISNGVKAIDSDVFNYTIRDQDNDTGSTTLTINTNNTINTVDDVHILNGTSGADILNGGNYTDIIDTKAGNDTLFGGLGADTLIGGLDSDSMTGGVGKDTFVWKNGDSAGCPTDTITDFTKGSGGDVLDLADLLTGEAQTAKSLDSFLNISYNNSTNNTTIAVDTDGGATFNSTQKIVLNGVDLTAGGTLNSDLDILTMLINNGNLKTDL